LPVRDTSMEVYVDKVLPSISESRRRVFAMYWRFPNASKTNEEMCAIMTREDPKFKINRFTPRRGELCKMGLLEEKVQRICTVTGNRAWAVGLTEKGKRLYKESGVDGQKILAQERL